MKKPHAFIVSILTGTLIIFLSACNQDSQTPKETASSAETKNSVAPYNSCDLLSTADIQEIFQDADIKITQKGNSANPIGQKICFYDVSGDEMKFVQTSLIRTSDMSSKLVTSGQNAKTIFLNSKELVDNPESVNGIGSEAYYGGSGLKFGAGLNVLVNDNISINITVGLGFGNKNEEAHLKTEKTLAQKILPKL